jgi:N-acetylneuraminic acid mutarotase
MRTFVALGLVSATACGIPSPGPSREPAMGLTPPPDPCAATGHWRPMADPPSPGRVDHTAVWTGHEMVMWGGTQGSRSPFDDGGRYDPTRDRWRPTSHEAAPLARDDHAAVWTGREMIVWGGNSYAESDYKLDDGGRYDPERDAWRRLPESPLVARDDPRAVWTGDEMIVWGGRGNQAHLGDGAAYDPARDRWRPLSSRGAPAPREDHTAVWTGREMIVWGGWSGADDARTYALGGGRYDPRTDTWRPMSTAGAPPLREDHAAIWTGREMIVWGGVIRDGTPAARQQRADGGRYDPVTDTWRPLAADGAPGAREDDVVVWTGREMLVWGGQRDEQPLAGGARYVPDADRWCPLPTAGAPRALRDAAGVWTGDTFVVWGGRDGEGAYPAVGAVYSLDDDPGDGSVAARAE